MVHERSQRIAVAGLEGNGDVVAVLHSPDALSTHDLRMPQTGACHDDSLIDQRQSFRGPAPRIGTRSISRMALCRGAYRGAESPAHVESSPRVAERSRRTSAFRTAAFSVVSALCATLVPHSAFAQAGAPVAPSCGSNMYVTQGPLGGGITLTRIDPTANPVSFTPVGPATAPANAYNGSAYNPADNYIYAVRTSDSHLLKIGSTGQFDDLGAITNFPANALVAVGEIGTDGFYYTRLGGGNADSPNLYKINLTTRVATLITPPPGTPNYRVADWAWFNGMLYGQEIVTNAATGQVNGQFYQINPATGALTKIGTPQPAPPAGRTFGAMISASNAMFGVSNNGGLYQFNLTDGTTTKIADSAPASQNDGARCVNSAQSFSVDLAITKDDGRTLYRPGANVVYTIVVSNNGPFGVQGATVTDALPAGITTASWTCGTPVNSGSCGVASGSAASGNAINNALVSLPANSSVTFTLTMTVPAGFTGDLANTVTTRVPDTATETNTANNTATDTDTPETANLAITKTNTPASGSTDLASDTLVSGSTTTYSVIVTNNGPGSVTGAIITDTPVARLTCPPTNPVTITGSGVPAGSFTISNLTGAGIVLGVLANGQQTTLSYACTVN